jgi:hypothetical protein
MTMRNNAGFLKVEHLKAGEIEQCAIVKGGNYNAVTLGWQPETVTTRGGFYIHREVRKGSRFGHTLLDNTTYYDDVDEARRRFNALCK